MFKTSVATEDEDKINLLSIVGKLIGIKFKFDFLLRSPILFSFLIGSISSIGVIFNFSKSNLPSITNFGNAIEPSLIAMIWRP